MTALNIRSLNKKSQRKSDLESKSEKSEISKSGKSDSGCHGNGKGKLLSKPQQKSDSPAKESQEFNGESAIVFQAVGIIEGEVSFADEQQPTVTLDGKEYSLLPSGVKQKSVYRQLRRLKKDIEKTGISTRKLLVYPRITHSQQTNYLEEISFQVMNFDYKIKEEINTLLGERGFFLRGLWQFIPVCSFPCISVFKNSNDRNIKNLKKVNPINRVKLLEPCHVPVLWENPSVKPFHYDPNLNELDKDSPMFIKIKARFVPEKDCFQFEEQVELPLEEPPRFLKVTEEDKRAAEEEMQQKLMTSEGLQEEVKPTKQTHPTLQFGEGLTAVALAKRLGVSDSTVSQQSRKGEDKFAVWSRNKDPDGLAWQRCETVTITASRKSRPRYFPVSH